MPCVASLQLSSSVYGQPLSSSSSSLIMRGPLNFSSASFSGMELRKKSNLQKRFVVEAKRLLGIEEAIKIRRERELLGTKIIKRPPLRRGKVSQRLPVPDHIPKPPYVGSNLLPEISPEHQIPDSEGIACMRAACELAARVLDSAGKLVRPSVTTNEIDKAVHQMIIDAGAYPSPLGYGGFPKSVCTSVNECVCHGIPDSRQLQVDGDIINIDVTVYLNDVSVSSYKLRASVIFLTQKAPLKSTFPTMPVIMGTHQKPFFVATPSVILRNALSRYTLVTEECLHKGIAVCKDGVLFRKIGKRISEHAEQFGFGVVDRFVGHGVGTVFHSEPFIFHHRNDQPGRMVEGQTFTIEPILTLGSTECITWEDNWTTLTADGRLAAQFEHTILITRTGAEILTKY
ncbi:hypothetical protein RHGRI_026958 [Rhododendron griersonianum]|uniref:Peptidase M24 domain-containing protein n=1 Tax=Rhododendron griersonianum TaxID=479676 RepID=A0AAV6IYM1_9ERIC|nr:hypothetical protein RHGRI_026958 [Rhododendron griersonianum]